MKNVCESIREIVELTNIAAVPKKNYLNISARVFSCDNRISLSVHLLEDR